MRRFVMILCVLLPNPAAAQAPVPREFRGAWVASVANIDWPSKKGLTSAQQQAELIALLDKAAALRLNAIVLQVRPAADALYASKLEPWSEYLTGTAGQAPAPFYDPLEFAVRAAHERALELHAWFNPYRARHPTATGPIPANHVIKTRPDLARPYGKHYWLNPTSKEVQDHSIAVILDVVRRYDIDGIHIDDYFYPYKEKDAAGKLISFPDDDTWAAYQKDGGKLGRDDWRRAAVNTFVERMYRETKAAKPWVKVGISPFGIWRPGHPAGIVGLDQYAELYADAKRWLNEGWVDYFSPQLYWPVAQEKQSFPKLLAWWVGENTQDRLVWPGLFTSKYPAAEIVEQIKVTRKQPGATGHIHFSMKALMNNKGGIADTLKAVYAEPALVPATPWAAGKAPPLPEVTAKSRAGERGILQIYMRPEPRDAIRLYVVRSEAAGKWSLQIVPARPDTTVRLDAEPTRVLVTTIDRAGRESAPARIGQ